MTLLVILLLLLLFSTSLFIIRAYIQIAYMSINLCHNVKYFEYHP